MRGAFLTNFFGVVLGAAGLFFIAALFFFQSVEKERRSLVDAKTFCPEAEGKTVWGIKRLEPPEAPGGIAVVIDATDSLDEKARKALREFFGGGEYLSSLNDFQRVRVYALEESIAAREKPAFDLCVPPNKTVSPWLDNPRKRREEFDEKFVGVLLGIVEELARREEANRSPIAAMLGATAGDNARVIFVSDMMEHSPGGCSLYKKGGEHDYPAFQKKGCAPQSEKLRGTQFDILFVAREKLRELQNPSLVQFWKAHFEENGATARFLPLAVVAADCEKTAAPPECKACREPNWPENYKYCANF